jgi:hypothetical protein
VPFSRVVSGCPLHPVAPISTAKQSKPRAIPFQDLNM